MNKVLDGIISAELIATFEYGDLECSLFSNIISRGYLRYKYILINKYKTHKEADSIICVQQFVEREDPFTFVFNWYDSTDTRKGEINEHFEDFQFFLNKAFKLIRKKYHIRSKITLIENNPSKWRVNFILEVQNQMIINNTSEVDLNKIFLDYLIQQSDYLDLSNLQLDHVPEEIFKLRDIRKLDLSHNNLLELPEIISELNHLEVLLLNNNQLESLPTDIGNLKNLKVVDLSENTLFNLPEEFCELENIETLIIRDVLLEEIPSNIGNLKKLIHLEIKARFIKSMPNSLCELTNLEKLVLDKTSISQLPQMLGDLSNLIELQVIENENLIEIPASIGQLRNLKYLHLFSNNLSKMPSSIGNLENVERLYLNDNQIEEMPPEITLLESLEYLNLQKNKLKSIPNDIFEMKKLEYLNVKNNFVDTDHFLSLLMKNKNRESTDFIY